ncbi:MAG TPA: YciI family protein [Candidatus Acidoferrales bacterium]|jgi:hypothetical protein|nr:YciI family protein [Candidatus Acidoferrales bacterium]
MESYILLLHDRGTPRPQLSPEEIQAIIAKYKAWGQRLRDAGRIAGASKLEDGTGRVMRGQGAQVRISDGPFTETKDVIGGFYILNAASYDEAVELCRDCPHLEYGSGIEIRRVQVV